MLERGGFTVGIMIAALGCSPEGLERWAPALSQTFVESPPVLYSNPSQGSPVRGAPGELLFLAGADLTSQMVVYYKRMDGEDLPSPPAAPLPATPTAEEGPLATVTAAAGGHGLTVLLPSAMQAGRAYALWATLPQEQDGEWLPSQWSNGVRINDARPLWITPSRHFRASEAGWLPRTLKVVGRNLDPAPGAATLVRLSRSGSSPATLTATRDPLDRYVARVRLPLAMARGTYAVSVSRDGGAAWVELEGQSFQIESRAFRQSFHLADYCNPNAGSATDCIVRAIGEAAAAGGGTVIVGAGTWILEPAGVTDQNHGIVVPKNVSLAGAGAGSTTIRRSRNWTAWAVFTLEGGNEITGIRFEDAERYDLDSDANTFFMLGRWTWMGATGTVDDVVFHANVFVRPYFAITTGFLPVRRLVVRGNEFGAYHDALYFDGAPTPDPIRFRLEDSIIADNKFKPGAYHDPSIGQGTIASQIGAALRLDFSDNQADGRVTDDPDVSGVPGWRAAFFFHARNNHEKVLIANNLASCTGDKSGDGEFIAFDSNGNRFAFTEVQPVDAADATSLTVAAVDSTVPKGHFAEHWVQIVAGRGLGQTRQVTSYATSANQSTFNVSPGWDVVPDPASSRVLVSRQWWQAFVLGNQVDIRGCLKPRKDVTRQVSRHGAIVLWAPTVDSVVDGNVQYEADGIILSAKHFLPWGPFPVDHQLQYFVDVRSNTIDGESDYDWTCSRGGIQLWHQATPKYDLPLLPAYGVAVAGNHIHRADSTNGGGIAFERAWFDDAPGTHWESTLVFHNTISKINGPPPTDDPAYGCFGSHPRVAVFIKDDHIANTAVLGNEVIDCSDALIDNGVGTVHDFP